MMKKIVPVLFFVCFAAVETYAQEKATLKRDTYPYWTLSKDVQRVRYKNIEQVPARISEGDPARVQSKGVARMNAREPEREGRVSTTSGYPTWSISKGVARQRIEKKK